MKFKTISPRVAKMLKLHILSAPTKYTYVDAGAYKDCLDDQQRTLLLQKALEEKQMLLN